VSGIETRWSAGRSAGGRRFDHFAVYRLGPHCLPSMTLHVIDKETTTSRPGVAASGAVGLGEASSQVLIRRASWPRQALGVEQEWLSDFRELGDLTHGSPR